MSFVCSNAARFSETINVGDQENYTEISDLISAMEVNGILGTVKVEKESGDYNENLDLSGLIDYENGSDSILFEGAGNTRVYNENGSISNYLFRIISHQQMDKQQR